MFNKRIARYAAAFTLLAAAHNTYAQNTSLIKQRVVDDLLAPPVNQTAIQSIVQTIRPDGTWPGINYKDVSRTGFQHKQHLDNMLELARAYKARQPAIPRCCCKEGLRTRTRSLDRKGLPLRELVVE